MSVSPSPPGRRPAFPSRKAPAASRRLVTLEVTLDSGPPGSVERLESPVSRTIEMRSDQTLAQLHGAIFKAFDRFDPHLYEFQMFGRRPMDRDATRFGLLEADAAGVGSREPVRDAERTKLNEVGLQKGSVFFNWFDFGDDWWHTVRVTAIADEVPPGRYPRVVARVGDSPPQYAPLDDEA